MEKRTEGPRSDLYSANPLAIDDAELSRPAGDPSARSLHRTQTEAARKAAKVCMFSDIEALERLHAVSTRLIREGDEGSLLEDILEAAIDIVGADFGTVQMMDPGSGALKILAHRGLEPPFLEFFNTVPPGMATSSARAMERRERVIVENVERSDIFQGAESLDVMLAAKIRSTTATPLVSREGRMLGVMSTHWRLPHRPDERVLHLVDLLARQAADAIERVRAEEALRSSLAEKVILLRELSHRTKNNLQVIGNLLSLQAATTKDEKLAEALSNAQDRIRTMALVHEKLYRSGNVSSLSMKEYVNDLVTSLLEAHQGSTGPVKAVMGLEEIEVPLAAALPCGLILNELVSNSLKHAFPGRKAGNIFLSLREQGKEIELRYRDDGPGLPPHLDLSRVNSLGLKLVYNLATRQLRGVMKLVIEPAMEFTFRFPSTART